MLSGDSTQIIGVKLLPSQAPNDLQGRICSGSKRRLVGHAHIVSLTIY